jgi:hypothetical protein
LLRRSCSSSLIIDAEAEEADNYYTYDEGDEDRGLVFGVAAMALQESLEGFFSYTKEVEHFHFMWTWRDENLNMCVSIEITPHYITTDRIHFTVSADGRSLEGTYRLGEFWTNVQLRNDKMFKNSHGTPIYRLDHSRTTAQKAATRSWMGLQYGEKEFYIKMKPIRLPFKCEKSFVKIQKH